MQPTVKAAAEGSAPPPSGGAGRSKYSDPKARARHAALVRWKKENPQAANLQERLAQIRAARLKKKAGKGGKGKGAKPKAPKQTPEQRKQAKLAEQATNREKTLKETGLAEDARGALDDLASGRGTDDDGGLIKLGLAEEADDGSIRLTAAGRAVHRAAGQGDTSKVKEAISRGTERRAKHVAAQQKKAQRDQAKVDKAKAGREKKRKADGKEKSAKEKAAPKPDKAAQTAENRKNVLSKMAAEDSGITSYGRDALAKLADGGGMDEGIVRAQEAMGLVERDSEGKPRATAQGRALLRAIDKGDYGMALDAVSRAKDKVAKSKAKQAKPKPKQESPAPSAADRGTGPRKPPAKPPQAQGKKPTPPPIGRRPQPMERKMAAIDEIVIDLKTLRDEMLEDDAIKAGRRNAASDQAQIDAGYELAMQLCDLFESLGADTGEEEEEAEGDLEEGLAEEEDEQMEGKAIAKRDDVNPKAGATAYGDVAFADEKNKKYPIDTPDHIRAAWNYIAKDENASKYSPADVAAIKKKIVAAWKDKIDDAGPPSAATKKSLDDGEMVYGSEIKAIDGDRIGGYGVLFGTADTHDASPARDFFDKNTDYWLKHFGWPRPMTYHHGLHDLKELRDDPVVGSWTKATVDDVGVFFEGELNRAHKYYTAVKELVRRGYLKLSSDSAPQWVIRERQPNGANYVKRWPVISVSPTVTPAEPRLAGVSLKALLAEYGIDDTDNREAEDTAERDRLDAAKALQDRQRRLLLECELELAEATIT